MHGARSKTIGHGELITHIPACPELESPVGSAPQADRLNPSSDGAIRSQDGETASTDPSLASHLTI